MAVKEIFSDGSHLPEPKRGEEMDKEKEKDPISQMEEASIRGHRLRAFNEALGGGAQPSPPPKSEEKYNLNIGDVFNAQALMVTKTMETLIDMQKKSPDATSSPYFLHLLDELKELKQKYDTPPPDPMDLLTHGAERLEKLAGFMKKNMGLTSSAPSDTSHLIEMERIRLEGQDRARQWEMEMEERRRQWKREDQRWEADHELRKVEVLGKADNQKRASRHLEALAASLVDGIDTERGATVAGQSLPDEGPDEGPVVIKQRSFKCGDCGATVRIPAGSYEAKCQCGSEYELVRKEDAISQERTPRQPEQKKEKWAGERSIRHTEVEEEVEA